MPTPGCSTSLACQGVLAKCPRTLTFSLGLGGRECESSLGREAATTQGSRLAQGSAGMVTWTRGHSVWSVRLGNPLEWVLQRARLCSCSPGGEFWAEIKPRILYIGGSGKWNQKLSLPQSQLLAVTLLVLLPLELILPWTFLLPFYLMGVLWTQFLLQGLGFVPSYSSDHTGGLPQSSGCRAWVVASSTGTFRGPL